ncbi:hypothetical protein L1987_32750 [Smallanthus sonchifolius]|uniref:Uncharacterized protein n=1 Tax=Smallanthus sonchifolius TaxID=185202 RepID=A0ACB9HQB2_9ASTR|nr:hypothetical protein L1987_32750 [Smallanthus sonchifolius]
MLQIYDVSDKYKEKVKEDKIADLTIDDKKDKKETDDRKQSYKKKRTIMKSGGHKLTKKEFQDINLDQLMLQGYEEEFEGDTCHKFKTKIRKSKAKQTAPPSLMNLSFSSNLSAQEVNQRKYESMSHIETFEDNQEGPNDLVGVNQTNIDSSLMYRSSQKNISQTDYTPFTYGNGLGSNQLEDFGGGITATTAFPQATSDIHDVGQGLDHHPFSSDQRHAYDDFLIYSDGNGLNRDLISESFSFSYDHVMQNKDTTGPRSTSKS